MKKIVMGLAAVAMAATMFATDFTGGLKLTGDLFNYNTDSGAMNVLSPISNANDATKVEATLSLASEKVGASIKIAADMSETGKEKLVLSGNSLWFKPIDALKLSLNGNSLSMKVKDGFEVASGDGYGVEYTAGDVVLSSTLKAPFITKANKGADAVINNIGLKAVYDNADAGKVTAIAVFGNNFKAIDLGLNYAKDFDGTKVDAMGLIWLNDGYVKSVAYVDVSGTAGDVAWGVKPVIDNTKATKVTQIDTTVKATVSDVTCEVTPKVTLNGNEGVDNVIGLNASVAYTIEGIGLKAIYDNAGFDTNDGSIAVEVTGTFDVMSWKVTPKFDMDKDTFSTAFETKVTF